MFSNLTTDFYNDKLSPLENNDDYLSQPIITENDQLLVSSLQDKLNDDEKIMLDLQTQIALAQAKQQQLTKEWHKINSNSNFIAKSASLHSSIMTVDDQLTALFALTNKVKEQSQAPRFKTLMMQLENSLIKIKSGFRQEMLDQMTLLVVDDFIITKPTTVSDFIHNDLQPVLNLKMAKKFPTLVFDWEQDCDINVNNLDRSAILEGTDLKVKISFLKSTNVGIEQIIFMAQITYDYDADLQVEILNNIFKQAIPKALWVDKEANNYQLLNRWAGEYHKIAQEVEQVIPLRWLLPSKDLALNLLVELFAASYWTCFHAKWWGIWGRGIDNGTWQAYSVIPNCKAEIIVNNRSITQTQKLFDLNQGYFNEIFTVIEQKLQAMGIKCQVKKKMIIDRVGSPFAVGMGNCNFYNSIADQTSKTFDSSKRQFFVQVSFDVLINKQTIEYPGVVFVLSDILKYYD